MRSLGSLDMDFVFAFEWILASMFRLFFIQLFRLGVNARIGSVSIVWVNALLDLEEKKYHCVSALNLTPHQSLSRSNLIGSTMMMTTTTIISTDYDHWYWFDWIKVDRFIAIIIMCGWVLKWMWRHPNYFKNGNFSWAANLSRRSRDNFQTVFSRLGFFHLGNNYPLILCIQSIPHIQLIYLQQSTRLIQQTL